MTIDLDDLHMESILYPWLDSDCMADETTDETFCDECDDEYLDEYEEDSEDHGTFVIIL